LEEFFFDKTQNGGVNQDGGFQCSIFEKFRRMKKCFVVDLLEFFKNRTTEIRHFDSRRHFEFYQKNCSMIRIDHLMLQKLHETTKCHNDMNYILISTYNSFQPTYHHPRRPHCRPTRRIRTTRPAPKSASI
jgi:hypothetical protein